MKPPTATRGVRKGDWNHNIGLIGIPGCGKSTVAVFRMFELTREQPCYLLAHDPEYALPKRLPDGRVVPLVRHDTVAQAEKAIRERGGGLHAVSCVDAVEVVALGMKLGQASVASARGGPSTPVIVLVDEVTNCREMGASHLGPTLQEALTVRRHRHCAIMWTTQSPLLVHHQYLSKATELYVFRLNSDRDVTRLVEHGGFPQDSAAQIKELREFQYLRKVPTGFGV